jgi:hypothetical protein
MPQLLLHFSLLLFLGYKINPVVNIVGGVGIKANVGMMNIAHIFKKMNLFYKI